MLFPISDLVLYDQEPSTRFKMNRYAVLIAPDRRNNASGTQGYFFLTPHCGLVHISPHFLIAFPARRMKLALA